MCRHLIVLPLALVAMALLAPPLAAGEATRTVRLELSADRNGPFAVENLALAWFDRDGGMMLPAAKRRCDH